jgi:3-oxoacyl-[acyl-carrier-protein] synthase III
MNPKDSNKDNLRFHRGERTGVRVAGTGSFLPGRPLTIDEVDGVLGELTEAPKKLQEWLRRMKGLMQQLLEVERYHYAIDPATRAFTEDNISMSVKAAKNALEMAGMKAEEIEFIAYGSAHQDQMPTASVRIQEALGIDRCGEVSVHANCTSAYKALLIAHELILSGRYRNALVLSSGMSSSELRAEYYNQPVVKKEELFLRYFLSDGAGALVLTAGDNDRQGLFLRSTYMESAGGNKPSAMKNNRPAYWMNPREEYELGYHHLAQMFQDELSRHFHETDGSIFLHGMKRFLQKYPADLSHLKFFQVNFPSRHIAEMIIEECAELGITKDKLYTKMSGLGYSGPPMAFISLDNIMREEKLEHGELILSFVTEVSKFMQAGYLMEWY